MPITCFGMFTANLAGMQSDTGFIKPVPFRYYPFVSICILLFTIIVLFTSKTRKNIDSFYMKAHNKISVLLIFSVFLFLLFHKTFSVFSIPLFSIPLVFEYWYGIRQRGFVKDSLVILAVSIWVSYMFVFLGQQWPQINWWDVLFYSIATSVPLILIRYTLNDRFSWRKLAFGIITGLAITYGFLFLLALLLKNVDAYPLHTLLAGFSALLFAILIYYNAWARDVVMRKPASKIAK